MLTNPFSTKTQDVSTIDADEVNSCGVQLSQALDTVGGGTYALGADVEFTGTHTWKWSSTGPFTFKYAVNVESRSETRVAEGTPLFRIAEWDFGTNGVMVSISTSGAEFNWPLDLPHGQVLNAVTLYLWGAPGHGGNIGTPPRIVVEYHDITTQTTTDLGNTVDPGIVAAYEVAHTLAVSGLTHTIDRTTRRYFAKIRAESGANAAAGLSVFGVSYTVTRTTIGQD